MNTNVLTKENLLIHWQGHRTLTRRTLELFPEKELFEFSLGGMRPFSSMVHELIAIAVPGLQQFLSNSPQNFEERSDVYQNKAELLAQWDQDTATIDSLYRQIPEADFNRNYNLFGQFDNSLIHHLFYFIDNEVHHRAQAYVYLRALNIQPPYFWERQ
ncbi:DinB family protein [Flavobacterium sp. JP2137]|uniref:DinB family protein n=1 Tax=Flavobacterium sp. JP2137 TaxID=3414510 RepID=UPI003D2FEC23